MRRKVNKTKISYVLFSFEIEVKLKFNVYDPECNGKTAI